ncbi:MAG: glycosyltransferase family 4 protein [Candidatus Parcubacteria bacterium]|nr:glycosyltransferase family 4 protein [Burkholderiales bacterium]
MPQQLRIIHTESSLGWGGQEIRILSESQGMMRRGHDVKLACPPEARIHAQAANWGVPVVALPIGRKKWRGLRSLRQWLASQHCDIVNTHSSTDSWLAALALAYPGTREKAPRIVRTRHISAQVPRGPLSRWLYMRAADRVVTTGEALRRQLVEHNGFSASRIESVPTGIDAGRFRPGERKAMRARFGLPLDHILVGIVATLRSWKGHLHLLEAMTRLPEQIQLVIVGDGPQREALEQRIASLGLNGRVRMQGQQADVLPWLRSLDIFALPSFANEGVPQALVQAMLVGLPCVTTSVGGIPEIAEHERTALLVTPRDPDALAAAITRLAGNEGLRRELGEAARKHCVEGYSYERMLDRMEAIYRNVSSTG